MSLSFACFLLGTEQSARFFFLLLQFFLKPPSKALFPIPSLFGFSPLPPVPILNGNFLTLENLSPFKFRRLTIPSEFEADLCKPFLFFNAPFFAFSSSPPSVFPLFQAYGLFKQNVSIWRTPLLGATSFDVFIINTP